MKARLPHRGIDAWGSGEFGASRGNRKHNGIDYACYPGTAIYSPVDGTITKHGYPYGDDLTYRYIEVTDKLHRRHRVFYVSPLIEVGRRVSLGEVLGTAQNIAGRYDDRMKNHIHYEIKHNGKYLDPEQ